MPPRLFFLLAAAAAAPALPQDQFAGTVSRLAATEDFTEKRFGPARWMAGGASYTTVEAGSIVAYDTASGRREVLVSAAMLNKMPVDNYAWAAGGRRLLLLFTNAKRVWRQNTRGDYWVLDLAGGKLRQLGARLPASSLLFARFSPDGRSAAYVHANNIYVEQIGSGRITQLTRDGSETIVNGTGDWVNEEEFGIRDGFRWSPDGSRIAYWQFDQSQVGRFALINNTDTTYPAITWIPYPKAGTVNSAVRVGVVSASGGKTTWINTAVEDLRNHYIARMEWAGDAELVLQHLNRLQNRNDFLLADARTGRTRLLVRDEDAAWVDIMDEFHWVDGGRRLLFLSERDGWRRLYSAPRDGAGGVKAVTPPGADVMDLAQVCGDGSFYYTASSPGNATRSLLFRNHGEAVSPAASGGAHRYQVAPDCAMAIHTRSALDHVPVTDLVRLPSHAAVRTLQDNAALAANAAPLLGAAPVEFFTVTLASGVSLDAWMIKPPGFDAAGKYPLIVYVYGEPAGTTVVDQWDGKRGLFHRALAVDGFVVVSFDNRGTPAPKGRDWRKAVYGEVGVLSSAEQADAVKTLLAARPYLDAKRVGIYGSSGGGSNTLNAMFRWPDVFHAGVSLAPVPDQRLYDTIYQERYMRLPESNERGYRAGSPIHHAEGLRGKLLLIHGTGDDNVHYQGTERLINRLVELGKPFDVMVYPNRTHAIAEGPGTRQDVWMRIRRYFTETLKRR